MKKILAFSLLFAIFFLFISCRKETNPTGDCPECQSSVDEIVFSTDFDWNNLRPIDLIINAPTSMIIEVTSVTDQSIIHKGYFHGGENTQYETRINIPAYYEQISVNGLTVKNTGDLLVVNLDTKTGMKSGNEIDDIVSYWDLDENSGQQVADAVGNNHGELIGGTWAPGISGSGIEFNGDTGVVLIPESESLDLIDQVTLTAWVKPYDKKESKIAQKGDWDGFNLGMGKWTGWKAYIMMEDLNYHKLEWDGGIPLMNEWYFLAMTYDGSSFKLYVNGLLRDEMDLTGAIHNNSRDFCIGSDNNAQKHFHGVIDEVGIYSTALSAREIQDIYQVMPNSDSDGDGVPDFQDDYSNDPDRAFDIYWPSGNPGSLAFEDLWPGKGDFDFNDLVLDFQFKTVTNAQNYVVEMFGDFTIKAVGASLRNGFGFQFTNNFENIEVSGSVLTEDIIQLNTNGTEQNQGLTTIIVFDNTYSILPSPGGTGVNVSPDYPYVEPETVTIYMDFPDNQLLQSDIEIENFNPFLIVNRNRNKEIHLPDFAPTSLADTSHFGTSYDDSNPATGRYYKTQNNVPWVIMLPEPFDYPVEKMEITEAHLHFVDWAQSSGIYFNDWYLDKPGYRNEPIIY